MSDVLFSNELRVRIEADRLDNSAITFQPPAVQRASPGRCHTLGVVRTPTHRDLHNF
ncbi:MAG: hypothetical protein M3315_00260 [Actinomycetota bacterium]|nr:hypothetical protein [Actinomycetota bacterium]